MVGFGSSLRMGRRAGWEPAYLDYETLKLLLSQIESVYEEEGHHNHQNTRDVFVGEPSEDPNSHHRHRQQQQRHKRRDYRDELFLESDSDAAFASSEEIGDSEDDSKSDDEEADTNQNRLYVINAQRFTLMGSSSSEDSHSADDSGQCGGAPWQGSGKKAALKSKKRRSKAKARYQQENDYFDPRDHQRPKGFVVDEESESYDPSSRNLPTSSLFNTPFQYNPGGSSESTALLVSPDKPSQISSAFDTDGWEGDNTPPREKFGTDSSYSNTMYGSNVKPLVSGHYVAAHGSQSPGRKTGAQKASELEEERRQARKQRRRRQLARLRRERAKKVPPHIRIAHSKSRSITERFLGLLRAEVEKVTLFAQARLGELADTAGSLRFLSSEELTEMTQSFVARASSTGYEHPLVDGGIHPSASSSSDEAAGGHGKPWFDSSSGDDESHASNQFAIPQTFSGGGMSAKKASSLGPFFGFGSRSPRAMGKSGQEHEQYECAKRKIEHFQELRTERPIFQRNDHIVGEDLLLVSAVDEADAYSAVGVELVHILKFICVNVIAVRKICRKHDRLLQNRMLGGYYHRKRTTRAQEERTLGGLIAHVAGDIYDAHPALIGLVNHGKLLGVYDLKIQQLANSRTVKVISSCLALALSEYEVSRTRADALATLNSMTKMAKRSKLDKNPEGDGQFVTFDFSATNWVSNTKEKLGSPCHEDDFDSLASDLDKGSGPPSTTSSVSLARLRFTVLSIAALREASRIKADRFATYLSRSSLSFTGQAVVGEGLDGCSRETLDFLVYYTPDAALLLDSSTLYEGLRRGQWRNMSIASVMRSSLAVALRGGKSFHEEEQMIINSLSILPKSEGIDSSGPFEGKSLSMMTSFSISRFVDIPPALLRANRYSLFLYTANYYIGHPTANTFVALAGTNVAYSAAIIGASSLSAILAAVLHCNVIAGHTSAKQIYPSFGPYRGLLILSSILALAGNIVQARGISDVSVPIAILGRALIGLGSADIVHRQFVVAYLHPSLIVFESARLVQFQILGMIFGLLVGSLVELAPFRSVHYGIQSLKISNWIMIMLWFFQLCRLLFCGGTFKRPRDKVYEKFDSASFEKVDQQGVAADMSDSSGSDPSPRGSVRLFHHMPGTRDQDKAGANQIFDTKTAVLKKKSICSDEVTLKPRKRVLVTLMKRTRKIMAYNIAVPVALALVVYTAFAQEVLFSSCALITDRYFAWRGNVAGFFLVCLTVIILPVDFVCEQIARRYEERTTIKRAILLLGLGLLVMVNWGSVFAMVANLKILFTETKDMRHHYYDWLLGIPQYMIGFLLTFSGLKALQGASRSLLSKVSPPNLRYIMTNLGTIVTFLGLFAQVMANFQIVAVGLSHRVINTDIVNSLVMPLLVGCIVAHYFVRKHYFFLM